MLGQEGVIFVFLPWFILLFVHLSFCQMCSDEVRPVRVREDSVEDVLGELEVMDAIKMEFHHHTSSSLEGQAWTSTLPLLLIPALQQPHILLCASAMTWLYYHTPLP